MLIVPLICGLGGSVRWAARWEHSLFGESQAEELLIVRYPNHRRFLMMTANAYYAAINTFREQGVARFEASFCHATSESGHMRKYQQLVVAHSNRSMTSPVPPADCHYGFISGKRTSGCCRGRLPG